MQTFVGHLYSPQVQRMVPWECIVWIINCDFDDQGAPCVDDTTRVLRRESACVFVDTPPMRVTAIIRDAPALRDHTSEGWECVLCSPSVFAIVHVEVHVQA